MEDQTGILEERNKKIFNFLKSSKIWVWIILAVLIVLGIYIRTLPMADHGGHPGLWDITTNSWTLGPDLDPWLFMRQAKNIITTGSFPNIDTFRNVPLGFDSTKETMLLPYMIDWTYHLVGFFYPERTPEYAGVIFPVIMFGLTIVSFFFFVREIFTGREENKKNKANLIALISTAFMITIPAFLSRTVAGIPEKESAAFFFMFLTFYFFIKAFKSEKMKETIVFGILSGIATLLTGLIWGGIMYIYLSIGLTTLFAFVLNKMNKEKVLLYSLWFIISIAGSLIFSNKESLSGLLTSIDSGLAFFVLLVLLIDIFIWKNNYTKGKLEKINIPKKLISIIIALLLVIVLGTIMIGPSFVVDKVKAVHQAIFRPVSGRWNTTVAENRQPYFTEWASSFGPVVQGIPLMLLLIILGSILLVYVLLKNFVKKERITMTSAYVVLIFAMIFSRYSDSGVLDGENTLSKGIYYLGVLIFFGVMLKYYFNDEKRGEKKFENLSLGYILLLVIFLFGLFSARGAVRLILVLAPFATIFVGYLIVELTNKGIKDGKEKKYLFGFLAIIILVIGIFTFTMMYREIKGASYSMIPTVYNQQWQKAMNWTREETPKDAVFGHWWDYGYWVQSIGERATVLDGGNGITFWNYYMGRLVLTGDNQKDALEFLYAHNTTHLLIDSTDIGKYGAFSSIGSNENYDRYSWIQSMILDESQTHETNESINYVYGGVIPLDEDMKIVDNGKEVFLPMGKAAAIGTVLSFDKKGNEMTPVQPSIVFVNSEKQYLVKVRYLYINERFIDFGSGIGATVYTFPSLINSANGLRINQMGAMMYLSPRVMKGMLAQKYILEDPFNKFPNFKIDHIESSFVTESLRAQGASNSEFIYYQGVQGPIKIWKIEYTGKEAFKPEYIDKDASKYLSWKL